MTQAFAYVQEWHERRQQSGWWHSFELPDGGVIEGVSSLASLKMRVAQFGFPEDLSGKRVLDVGTWDGWFAFEMERRGAEVVAIDRWENRRFLEIHDLLHSRVDYRQANVYDLDPDKIGRFDIVLFLGVLYHLKHPLLALERVASVATDMVAVESFVLRDKHRPGYGIEELTAMEFYEFDEFGGQFDNWVAPTVPCLLALCRTAGFARVELNNVHDYGAAVTCHRKWKPLTQEREELKLLAACHNENFGVNFASKSPDEYVSCAVLTAGCRLTRDTVQAEVGGYGAGIAYVGERKDSWLVNFKLPPGLQAGWHAVRLRCGEAVTNTQQIAVDIPLTTPGLEIAGVHEVASWQPSRVSVQSGYVAIWVRGLPHHADVHNAKVYVAGKWQETLFVNPAGESGVSQINALVLPGTPRGIQKLTIRFGEVEAAAVDIEVI